MNLVQTISRPSFAVELLGVALVTVSLLRPCSAGADSHEELQSLLSDLESAVENHSMEEIRNLHRLGDEIETEQLMATYEEMLAGSKGLTFGIQISETRSVEGGLEATCMRRVGYERNGRAFLDVTWSDILVGPTAAGHRILGEERLPHAQAIWTNLAVELEPENGRMSAVASIQCEVVNDAVDALVFNLNRGLTITSLADDQGREITFERIGTTILVPIGESHGAGERLDFQFAYAGSLFNETRELHYSNVNIGLEGSYASWLSAWYPQLMGETTASPGEIRFVVPEDLTVVSNGQLTDIRDAEDGREFVFEIDRPLTYSFAAGEYFHKSRDVDGVEVGVYLLREDVQKADLYVERTAAILDYLWHTVYGMYPYETFWIVEMPGRVAGRTAGSAEQGLAFFPDYSLAPDYFNDAVIAHEMGHSWWGTWVLGEGVLMSEGLAQLSYALAMEHLFGKEIMWRFVTLGTEDYFQAASNYFAKIAHQPSADMKLAINRWDKLMDLHWLSNTKAHFVFLMLRDEIGEEPFYQGLRQALAKFEATRMTLRQLQKEWESASQSDLEWFFSQWFERTGAPEFNVEFAVDPRGESYLVRGKITQSGLPYRCTVEVLFADPDSSERYEVVVQGQETAFEHLVSFEPSRVVLDPDYTIFRWTPSFREMGPFGDGFEKMFEGEFEQSVEQMTSYVESHPDDLMARIWLGSTLYRFLRKADLALEQFVYVVENGEPGGPYELFLPTAALYAGNIYDSMGEREKAVRFYRLAIDRDRTARYESRARRYLALPFRPLPPPPPLN
jgi:tetratricopeptide (TPR) repeat protein